jgi:HD-GYP domain-containing protein (c-di-GMP phosphodiesterase class II)/DNA-binding CsgD family transcriptional regulator
VADVTRIVEVLAALSLASDAADGFPPEATVRSALLATSLAADVGDETLVRDVLVGGLLRHIGCTGFAVEEAHRYGAGDDVALRHVMAEVDFGQPERAGATIGERIAAHAAPAARATAVGHLVGDGPAAGEQHALAQCDAAEHLAGLLPVSDAARSVASDAFERWDGHGGPAGKAGDDVALVARIVEIGYVAELFRQRQGRGGATAELRLRSGTQLDPSLVAAFLERSGDHFDLVDDPRRSPWEELLDREPTPHASLSAAQLDAVALSFGRFSDLKSVWFAGHAEAVASAAVGAAAVLGFESGVVEDLRRAALLHDIGRVAIPTGTWDAPRRLAGPERDRVRFHSWETQRILSSAPLLAPSAAIAGSVHERLDGSGYHRGLGAGGLDDAARLLAAADVAVALGEARPYRPALDPSGVARVLRDEVEAGLLDRRSVAALTDAMAGVAGVAVGKPPRWPDELSDREVEVLVLVARGETNKDIARRLGITAKTVAHHVAHVYVKTGVRSRAGATLYALERRLLPSGTG